MEDEHWLSFKRFSFGHLVISLSKHCSLCFVLYRFRMLKTRWILWGIWGYCKPVPQVTFTLHTLLVLGRPIPQRLTPGKLSRDLPPGERRPLLVEVCLDGGPSGVWCYSTCWPVAWRSAWQPESPMCPHCCWRLVWRKSTWPWCWVRICSWTLGLLSNLWSCSHQPSSWRSVSLQSLWAHNVLLRLKLTWSGI